MLRKIQAIPCKVLLVLTVACLLIGEVYPFSNFPMFASFSGRTYYVFLADQNGKAIPALLFQVPTNGIKKKYDAALKRAKKSVGKSKISPQQDQAAAEQTLRYLIAKTQKPPAEIQALQLVRVDLSLENGQLIKNTRTVGEVSLR